VDLKISPFAGTDLQSGTIIKTREAMKLSNLIIILFIGFGLSLCTPEDIKPDTASADL
jgi:hypothetical protein